MQSPHIDISTYIYIYLKIYLVNSQEYGTNPEIKVFTPLPAHSDWFLYVCGIVQMRLEKKLQMEPYLHMPVLYIIDFRGQKLSIVQSTKRGLYSI